MNRFDDDRYYRTSDPELRIIATKGTMSFWRHQHRGPAYVRLGGRVLYRGRDLNAFLDAHIIQPMTA